MPLGWSRMAGRDAATTGTRNSSVRQGEQGITGAVDRGEVGVPEEEQGGKTREVVQDRQDRKK